MITCPICASPTVAVQEEEDRFLYGVSPDTVELSVIVPVHTCRACGEAWTDEVGEDRRAETVIAHLRRERE